MPGRIIQQKAGEALKYWVTLVHVPPKEWSDDVAMLIDASGSPLYEKILPRNENTATFKTKDEAESLRMVDLLHAEYPAYEVVSGTKKSCCGR